MKKYFGAWAALCLVFAGLGLPGSSTATAQDKSSAATPPPKVLVIMREFLKPGRTGSQHLKRESAFVQAFSQAKWPEHYLAMDSLSGKPRCLFFVGYSSFEDWQKDLNAVAKNATLAAALDSAQAEDGKLLSSYESSTFMYRDDLSLRGPVDIPHMRYMEIIVFNVRPGHEHDFEILSKMYIDAYQKAGLTHAHWAAFEDKYGAKSGGKYIVITPMPSLAEADEEMGSDQQFASAVGAEDLKKMADLSAATIESTETNLFAFNPKMSYVSDSWTQADPDFWGQK